MNITVNNMKAIGLLIHRLHSGSARRSKTGNGKALICYLLYFIFGFSSLSLAQTNVLHIGEVTYPAGRTATIPVELENQSDIVGVQFEIVTPYALKAFEVIDLSQPLVLLNSQRADDHEVSVTLRTGYHSYSSAIESYYKRYRVMVYSPTNTKLNGSSGTLLTLQFDLPETLENGTELPVYFYETNGTSTDSHAEVILTDRQGQNIVSGFTNGGVTIENVPRPDIVPSAVTVAEALAEPGDELNFSWTVINEGDLATGAGWTEKLFLDIEDTGNRVYLGTTAYEGTLAAEGRVARSFTIALDAFPGVSGKCRPVVQLVPSADCGEIALDQYNNTIVGSAYSLYVKKHLVLTTYKNPIPENSNGSFACELRRTGDLSLSQTFNVTTIDANNNTGRFKVQSDGHGEVHFDRNQSKAYFYLYPINNSDINPNSEVTIVANESLNNGYDMVQGTVTLEDDERIPLTLTLNKQEYNEGEVIHVTATVPQRYYANETLNVYLSIEQNKRFRLPQRITFEEGATTASIDIPIVNDKNPANTETIKLTGTADRHQTAEVLFVLKDDDTPAISMTLTPTTVSEGAGPSAMIGTITRTGVTDNQITIKLSDDGDNDIYYSTRMVTMPAGTLTATFPLGVRDNSTMEGEDRTVNVTAAIYISDCNCESIGDKQSSVTVPVTITDNDGPALSITFDRATIAEGDVTGATFTVTRNTSNNPSALTVNLNVPAGDLNVNDMTSPATVTIPAGQTSVTGTIRANANSTEEGDRTITLVASATDYTSGTAWLLVSDRTIPDLQIKSFSMGNATPNAGQVIGASVILENIGAATMPAGTFVKVMQNGTEVSSMSIPEDIEVGGVMNCMLAVTVPTVPGAYSYTALVNPDRRKAELIYVNNISETVSINVQSLYTFTINTDKDRYTADETVTLSGTVTAIGEGDVSQLHVEPYVMFHDYRMKLDGVTDANGHFSVTYEIPAGYRGHFNYGVCNPDEGLTTSMGEFIVYGFERTSNDYIKHKIFKDEPYEGTITLRNVCDLPLHNITPALSGATENYIMNIESVNLLPGNGTAEIAYTITGQDVSPAKAWDIMTVTFTCDEGAKLEVPIYNYTTLHTPKLVASTTSINTTATKGVSRTYPVILTNMGQAESGKVTVSTPAGMARLISLATPAEMPSLQPGDSATIMLRLSPGNDLDVNVIQKGRIAINCENGDGVAVDFSIKVVSESKGALRVQVRDENTIYGNKDGEKPYVAGATVELKDLNTGVTVASGTTPDNTDTGILFEEINEGYYQLYVTADKHDSYRQNVVVSPGETTVHLATISYQAVSVSWDVVETEVEDEYEIITNVVYETMVPVPVVRMTAPDSIWLDEIEYGKATMFNVVLRNEGLITAEDVKITLPEAPGFTFAPLVPNEGFSLAAGQSYIIPVRVTRDEPVGNVKRFSPGGGGIPCQGRMDEEYKWPCGEGSKWACLEKVIDLAKEIKCTGERKPVTWHPGNPSPGPGGPGDPDYGYGGGIGPGGELVVQGLIRLACVLCECFCVGPPSPPCSDAAGGVASGDLSAGAALGCAGDLGSEAAKKGAPVVGCAEAMANGVKAFGPNKVMARNLLYAAAVKIKPYYAFLNVLRNSVIEKTNAPEMVDANPEGVYASIDLIDLKLRELYDAGTLYDLDPATIPNHWNGNTENMNEIGVQLVRMMPNYVANLYDFKLQDYVERMQNIYRQRDGLPMSSENHVDQAKVQALMERYDSCMQAKLDLGFATWEELVASANKDRLEYFEGQSGNTCATVKLEIEQKLVMTRQAFRGTLTIDNATANDLTDINLDVIVENLLGEQATRHEFQINFESIDGFEGSLEGPWTLGPNAKGVVTILFIPTKFAAPDTLTTYAFGGNLSWFDGSTYQTRGLYPVKLQVKPSPELDLTYFMQQDIYGDNPLTKEVVEPTIPAEFSVLIHNKGKGDATNIRMMTKQPKIVENEKGLMADFTIVSSSLNGGEKAMALDSLIATQFGDIPAGGSSYATWDLTSSLLGHFIDYDISVNHVTSYGNPDLSLLDQVTIHELIHSVNARFGEQDLRAWVCNDFEDGHSEPDHIYFSNGTDEPMVTLSTTTTVTVLDETRCRVSVTVPQKEWFYTAVADPTGGASQILAIYDETTEERLDPENFWTTQWTMQDGFDPLAENKLHIVDYADGPKTFNYIVQFEPSPDLRLDVVSIETVPDENNIAETPINELTVTFNKPVNPETFTRDDVVLRYEGAKQTTELPIVMVSATQEIEANTAFTINTSALSADGYYILQVNTQDISDMEGFLGKNGKQVSWMLFQGGLVHYNIGPWPSADAGEVELFVDNIQEPNLHSTMNYGTTIVLKAMPKHGYTFGYWAKPKNGLTNVPANYGIRGRDGSGRRRVSALKKSDLEQFSTDAEITVEMNQTRHLVAVFEPEKYLVTVDCDEEAGSINFSPGYYDYGTVVNLEAAANDGYQLLGFVINGSPVDCQSGHYEYTVSDNDNIQVRFKDLSPVNVILQDTKDYEPELVQLANVKLQRSFRKGTWNTICLPCHVYNPEEVFGTGTLLARLTGVENNVMQFSYVNVMEANIPYLIKPGHLNSSSLADGQTKTSFFDILGTSVETPGVDGPIDHAGAVQFIGSYVAAQVPGGAGYYYISSDQLYYIDATANVPSGRFRGYFHVDGGNLVKRMGIRFGNDIPTSYIDVPVAVTADIYTLDGVLVRKASEGNIRGLKPGIYIMGGQKVRVQ